MSLAGKRIVVTRAREQAGELIALLEAAGAEALVFPCIVFAEPESWDPADAAIEGLRAGMHRSANAAAARVDAPESAAYDWLLLTSANGVTRFLNRAEALGLSASDVAAAVGRVAAVGPATASALAAHGIEPDVLPEEFVGESLLDALLGGAAGCGVGPGTRVLLPRAQEARDVLPDGLRAAGAIVDVVPVYRTLPAEGDPAVLERLRAGEADAVVFTSPSTVRGFVRLTGGLMGVLPAACIGPVAAAAARANGFEVAVEPSEHTVPALVCALEEYFRD